MILRNGTMNEVIDRIKNKKVYIFGTGNRLKEMYMLYHDQMKLINLAGYIDNNVNQQGRTLQVDGTIKDIISVNQFLQQADDNTVVIFSMYDCVGAIELLDSYGQLEHLNGYVYSMIQAADFDEIVYPNKSEDISFKIKSPKQQTPKVIHYCWFGKGKMSELNRKCLESWKKFCPDYQIIGWDETNYDVAKNQYMKKAYEEKKWAYVSDYARLDVVNQFGGIYMDTDVELVKALDDLLGEEAFCGFQDMTQVAFGLGFGAKKDNVILEELLNQYESLEWDGGKTPCPCYQTEILKNHGLISNNRFQRLDHMTVLPAKYLSAKSIRSHRVKIMPETYAIHHFAASWYTFSELEKKNLGLWERVDCE